MNAHSWPAFSTRTFCCGFLNEIKIRELSNGDKSCTIDFLKQVTSSMVYSSETSFEEMQALKIRSKMYEYTKLAKNVHSLST